MTALASHLEDYLSLRRALGFKLDYPGRELPKLVAYVEATGSTTLTVEVAVAWARLPQGVQPLHWAHRLGAVRGFARYMQTIDPSTEVPPRDIFGVRQQRPAPYIWSDEDIRRLVEAASRLEPALRAATCEALFGLLAASGMRISEALSLKRDDVDFGRGIATVHGGKFGRERLVPLHESTVDALGSYARRRDRLCPRPRPDAFFVSSTGRALCINTVRHSFNQITTVLGLRTRSTRPRIHDLRHTFAVRTLVNWLRDGEDVDAAMPVLAGYLGHIDPASTYWYLEASPELMQRAAANLDRHLEGQS